MSQTERVAAYTDAMSKARHGSPNSLEVFYTFAPHLSAISAAVDVSHCRTSIYAGWLAIGISFADQGRASSHAECWAAE